MSINHFFKYIIYILMSSITLLYLPLWTIPNNFFLFDISLVSDTIRNATVANLIAFFSSLLVISRLQRYAQNSLLSNLLPTVSIIYALMIAIFMSLRAAYSIKIILIGFLFNCLLLCLIQSFNLNRRRLNLLVVPFGIFSRFETNHLYKFTFLKQPIIKDQSIDGLVVDFRTGNLPKKWESFVAEVAVSGIPVYSANHLGEALSGMVDVHHLMENNFGVLSPSPVYVFVKRIIDFVIVFVSTPIVLPIGFIVALLVKIDSEGGAIFKQKRVGFRGREFYIYKFRSMRVTQYGLSTTPSNDHHRITRVGKVIRKYRLDEIPQLWNVLKGDMSLIGPRPETPELHLRYEKEIPFFNYRLIVRPGLTGWAQVMQGYTTNREGAIDKLSYDFYYIKHFSFWLDALIFSRTFKVVLHGTGSK